MTKARRLLFWQVVLLPTYACALILAFLAPFAGDIVVMVRAAAFSVTNARAFRDALDRGPMTTEFNHRMRDRSLGAHLVGSPQDRVHLVLGEPDSVRQYWDVIGANGVPPPGARFVTTFEYFPFGTVPFSVFQVHCTGGVVRGLEMFDD